MRFGFMVTGRCNASCTHCAVSSGPERAAALPTDKILSLMDEGAAIWKRERAPDEPLQFGISGGEPFLDFAQLLEIVAHGSHHGARMTCVTNGSWAASDEKARERLTALKQAGLSMLAVSTSRFHQRFVKIDRVERALRIAREVGLRIALKCVVSASEAGGVGGIEEWARAQKVDKLELIPLAPSIRHGAALPEGEYVRHAGLPEGRCPSPMITVQEEGRAYTCCIPGSFNDLLALGNVFETGLERIFERFYLNGTQQVLRHRGPGHFARAIIAQGQGHRLRDRYEGVCDLCTHIASDPQMAAIAEREGRAFARAQYRSGLWSACRKALGRLAGTAPARFVFQAKGDA